jgi:hypothetical protein
MRRRRWFHLLGIFFFIFNANTSSQMVPSARDFLFYFQRKCVVADGSICSGFALERFAFNLKRNNALTF